MLLGETFRLAREEKGQTISQVAEATRMMVQIVEDLEREDFRRIAAPIYGRGFIKLYAEHLGLDPEPLIRDFMEIYTGLRPRLGFAWTLGITSALFALGHWEKTHLYAAAVLPVGLALGWVREKTGSTRATALFHALYNLTGWLLTYLAIA